MENIIYDIDFVSIKAKLRLNIYAKNVSDKLYLGSKTLKINKYY